MRARVERLLRDDFRLDDLTRLFLYARDYCDGRESVKEVGDFVAHHSEREKGPVTKLTRDWCITARFHWWAISKNFALDRNQLPANFGDFLYASFQQATPDVIRNSERDSTAPTHNYPWIAEKSGWHGIIKFILHAERN